MSVELESAKRLNTLKAKADAKTGETSATLADAVDTLIAGFGQGGGGDDSLMIFMRAELTEFHTDEPLALRLHLFREQRDLIKCSVPKATACGAYVFYGCPKLEYIDLGNSPELQNTVMNGVHNIKTIILRNSALVTLNSGFINNNAILKYKTCLFYVPSVLIEEYKLATNWTVVADQFRPLEEYTVDGTITGAFDESKITG